MMGRGMILAFLTVGGWVFLQPLVLRLVPPRRHFRAILFLYAASFTAYLLLYWNFAESFRILDLLPNGALLHLLLFCTTMQCYYYVDRPITLRILVELSKRPGERLFLKELQSLYSVPFMVAKRLEILSDSAYITRRDEKWFLTRKGIFFARIFRLGGRVLGTRP